MVDFKNVVFGQMCYVHKDYPLSVAMAVKPVDENMVTVVLRVVIGADSKWSEEMTVKFSDLKLRQK